MKLIICLPIKDEEKILKSNVKIILAYLKEQNFNFDWQVVLTVNGSSDNSFNIAQKISNEDKRVACLNLELGGKGRAVKHCFDRYANQADYLLYMDIDLAVDLLYLSVLFKEMENYDLVFGSRLMPESITNRSWFREFSSRVYNYLSRLILAHPYLDLQCGFKVIKKDAYLKIREKLEDDNWFFDTEWIIVLHRLGFKLKEIPVAWQENRYQKRASRVKVFKDAFKFLLALKKLYYRLR